MIVPEDDTDAMPDAIVSYMTEVNKLMAWCEWVRPEPNTPAYADWAGARDAILRELDDKRRVLAKLCAKDDAGNPRQNLAPAQRRRLRIMSPSPIAA
jgi:hypothetical protein